MTLVFKKVADSQKNKVHDIYGTRLILFVGMVAIKMRLSKI